MLKNRSVLFPVSCSSILLFHLFVVLKDAMVQRVIADLENAINRAKKSGFDQSGEELATEVEAAYELVLRLKRLEKLRSEVSRVFI